MVPVRKEPSGRCGDITIIRGGHASGWRKGKFIGG